MSLQVIGCTLSRLDSSDSSMTRPTGISDLTGNVSRGRMVSRILGTLSTRFLRFSTPSAEVLLRSCLFLPIPST